MSNLHILGLDSKSGHYSIRGRGRAWNKIKIWNDQKLLSKPEMAALVASLINSMDAVANTAGTYYAHLKELDRRAKKPFVYSLIKPTSGTFKGTALHGDAYQQLKGKYFDLLYLDPPYNSRNYSSYYHLPETISRLTIPDIREDSLAGLPKSMHPARDNLRAGASPSYIERLIQSIYWDNLVFHYCDKALIPLTDVRNMLRKHGVIREFKLGALGYTTSKSSRKIDHHVFLVSKNA